MLNDTQIKALKPSDKVYRKTDQQGLCLEIRPNGKKYWYYRFNFDNRATMMLIGEYPSVSLAQAREKHANARALLKLGKNPITHARDAQRQAHHDRQDLFVYHAKNFLAKLENRRSAGYIRQLHHNQDKYILPVLGNIAIKDIDTVHIIDMMHKTLKKVQNNQHKRGTGEVTAELCRQQTSFIFRYAMRLTRGLHDPTIGALSLIHI